MKKIFLLILFLFSCSIIEEKNKETDINFDYVNNLNLPKNISTFFKAEKEDRNININIDLNENKDIFFLFTNLDKGIPKILEGAISDPYKKNILLQNQDKIIFKSGIKKKDIVLKKQNKNSYIKKNVLAPSYLVGDIETYNAYNQNNIQAKLVSKNTVDTANGKRNLELWVDTKENEFINNNILIELIQKLFLKEGLENDIYDLVTDIYGSEWGKNDYSNLLDPDDNTIKILFYDIDSDGEPNKGSAFTVGFYDMSNNSIDNFTNKGLWFFMDSKIISNPNFFEYSFSTLAHEFQHMINFYQRNVLEGKATPVWLDEGLSMVAEDFLADFLYIKGPRGVKQEQDKAYDYTDGSIEIENYINRVIDYLLEPSLKHDKWYSGSKVINSYSLNYMYLAYLVRNFGGVNFIKKLMNSNFTDPYEIINDALIDYKENYYTTLQKWGIATLLSNIKDVGPSINYNSIKAFESKLKGKNRTYKLGSINAYLYKLNNNSFNILRGIDPFVQTESNTNIFYLAGKNIKKHNFKVFLPANMVLNIVYNNVSNFI